MRRNPANWKRLRAACKGVLTVVDAIIYAHIERYVVQLEAIYKGRAMLGLYKHLKRPVGLGGRASGGQQFVRDENGVLLRNKDGILRRWVRFFDTLLNAKAPKLNPFIIERVTQPATSLGARRVGSRLRRNETIHAVCDLQPWKGPGVDSLLVELLEADKPEELIVIKRFHAILEDMWNGGGCRRTENMLSSKCSTRRRTDPTATITGGSRFYLMQARSS